jgi:Zn-dependent protease with chaperone function
MSLAAPRPLPIPTDAVKAEEGRVTPGAPPWLWLWIVLFAISLPGTWGQRHDFAEMRARVRAINQAGELDWWDFALHAQEWLTVALPAALLLGFATVLFPWVRSWFVQRRYKLCPLPNDDKRMGPTVREIESFVHGYAPTLVIVGNPALIKVDPFVYPLDFRRSALAITGQLLLQWTRNKDVAKAILLHEIGHYRRGDGRVIGVGSVFESLVRYVAPALVIFLMIPTFLKYAQDLPFIAPGAAMDGAPTTLAPLTALLQAGAVLIGRFLFASTAFVFGFLIFVIAPLAAIWSAEFTADRFAADSQGTATHARTAIASEKRASWWVWLFGHLSHPPAWMRLWMLERRLPTALLWLAIVFPLAYLLPRLLSLHGSTALNFVIFGNSPSEIAHDLADYTRFYLEKTPQTWLAMAAVLFFWPLVVRGWERLMTGEPAASTRVGVGIYWACAAVLVVLALVGYALAGMEPTGPKTL